MDDQKVLVIFEEIPERTRLFVFTNPAPHIIKEMRDAHGTIVGTVDADEQGEDAVEKLALHFKDSNVKEVPILPWHVAGAGPLEDDIKMVVFCGICL
jgi:hypothetical protein